MSEDKKIFNPWNPRNKVIDDETIKSILNKYGVKEEFTKPELFRQACVHKSYVDRRELWAAEDQEQILAERPPNCLPLQEADNEECEFAGDSLLGCVVALYLYERYAGKGEGFLTRLRTRIVNNKMLGSLAKKMGLEEWIVVSRHVEDVCVGGRGNLRLLGSMFEAWVHALYKNFEAPSTEGGKGLTSGKAHSTEGGKGLTSGKAHSTEGGKGLTSGEAPSTEGGKGLTSGEAHSGLTSGEAHSTEGGKGLTSCENESVPGFGFTIVQKFIINVIQKHVNFVELITDDNNFKDQLLRHFQSKFHQPPRYKEVEVVGPPHDRTFTMGVVDPNSDSKILAKATARNKKVAEQEASRLALVELGVISNDDSN